MEKTADDLMEGWKLGAEVWRVICELVDGTMGRGCVCISQVNDIITAIVQGGVGWK